MTTPLPARRRRWPIILPVVFVVLGLVAYVGAKWALGVYLASEGFRSTVNATTGGSLHAAAEFAPFHLEGSDLSSDGLKAEGYEDGAFSSLEVNQVRAHWNMRKLFDRVCELESVNVGEITLNVAGPRRPAPTASPSTAPAKSAEGGGGFFASLAPNRVEVGTATVEHANLTWDGGKLHGATFHAVAQNTLGRPSEWKIDGSGGRVVLPGWPALDLQSTKLRYREPTLYVEEATLRQGIAGSLKLEGEVTPGDALALHAVWARMPLDALLAPDWRQHLYGTLNGEADIKSPLPAAALPAISGKWSLSDGRLEALPLLDALAVFTGTAQFRNLALSRAGGDFRSAGARLELTHLLVESNGIARLEGDLTIDGEKLVGTLQLGLAPNLLVWLPGAKSDVFATAREGYQWTAIHLSGTTAHPVEDLSGRIVTAAAANVLGTTIQGATELKGKAQEAAKGLIDSVFGK